MLSEVLFEFRYIGAYVSVSAIDPVSGTEVSIQAASHTSETVLKRIAAKKLEYVLGKLNN